MPNPRRRRRRRAASSAIAGGVGDSVRPRSRAGSCPTPRSALLRAEIDERLAAAQQFTNGGHPERAALLRAEATVLTDLLGDV